MSDSGCQYRSSIVNFSRWNRSKLLRVARAKQWLGAVRDALGSVQCSRPGSWDMLKPYEKWDVDSMLRCWNPMKPYETIPAASFGARLFKQQQQACVLGRVNRCLFPAPWWLEAIPQLWKVWMLCQPGCWGNQCLQAYQKMLFIYWCIHIFVYVHITIFVHNRTHTPMYVYCLYEYIIHIVSSVQLFLK